MIKILDFSDLHYGHRKNKLISRNFNLFLKENKRLIESCDLIIFSGDIYDTRLQQDSKDAIDVIADMLKIANICMKHRIKLRFLKGTPSHDYDQIDALALIIEEAYPKLDFKYFNRVDIEYIKDLDINILYVPDEVDKDTYKVFQIVKEKLKEKDLEKVDIAVTHMWYKHHVPDIKGIPAHKEEDYESIVKHYIINGHDHTPRVFNKIITVGSFDRLRHNEEEPKGVLYLELGNPRGDLIKFIENKHAMKFIKIKVNESDLNSLYKRLDKELKRYRNYEIMLVFDYENELYDSINSILKRYKDFNITYKRLKAKEHEEIKPKPIKVFNSITKDNIIKLLKSKLDSLGLEYNINILERYKKEFDKSYL